MKLLASLRKSVVFSEKKRKPRFQFIELPCWCLSGYFSWSTDLQHWSSFRFQTVRYFILVSNLFFYGKTGCTLMFLSVLVPAALLSKACTNLAPLSAPLAGLLLCRWRKMMGILLTSYWDEITLVLSSAVPSPVAVTELVSKG